MRKLIIKRLFLLTFAIELVHGALWVLYRAILTQPLTAGEQQLQQLIEQQMTVLLCMKITNPAIVLVFAALVYLLCRPADLKEEYKAILFSPFFAAFLAHYAMVLLGIVLIETHPATVFDLAMRLAVWFFFVLTYAVIFALVGFVAATISYVRRGGKPLGGG